MEPQPGIDYRLELGPSLLDKRPTGEPPELCTLRFDFKPQSAARATQGQLDVQLASQKVRPPLLLPPPLPYFAAAAAAAQAPTCTYPSTLPRPHPPSTRRCRCRWATRRSRASGSLQRATAWMQWPFLTAPRSGWSCWARL